MTAQVRARAESGSTTATTSHPVALPAYQAGDVVIIAWATSSSGSDTDPAGWTRLSRTGQGATLAPLLLTLARVMTAADVTNGVTSVDIVTASLRGYRAYAVSLVGAEKDLSKYVVALSSAGGVTSGTTPALTTVTPNNYLMAVQVIGSSQSISQATAGFTTVSAVPSTVASLAVAEGVRAAAASAAGPTFSWPTSTARTNALIAVPATTENVPPVVNAGPDQSVEVGTAFTFTGTASDVDGTIASVSWTAITPGAPALTGANTLTASGTAPKVSSATAYTYRLTATDNAGASSTDDVVLIVTPKGVVYVPTPAGWVPRTVLTPTPSGWI